MGAQCFALVLTGLGALVSLIAGMSIVGARFASNELCNKWEKQLKHSPQFVSRMPSIRGGGHVLAHALGFVAPFGIPSALVLAWAYLCFLSFIVGR
jgi:hypothetical protein